MSDPSIDEVLLDALKTSTQGRVYLFALEEQLIAFLRDRLDLPQLETKRLNSFQRLLAHKLGDYYALAHAGDRARGILTFTRLPNSQVPAKTLVQLWQETKREQADASGVSLAQQPKMRIMKRADKPHSASTTPRQASPAPSSAQSKDQDAKDKETRYKLARARIFKDFEPDVVDTPVTPIPASDDNVKPNNSERGIRSSPSARSGRSFKPRMQAPAFDPDYSRTLTPTMWSNREMTSANIGQETSFEAGPRFMENGLHHRHAQYGGSAGLSTTSGPLANVSSQDLHDFGVPARPTHAPSRPLLGQSSALPAPRPPAGNIWQYKSTIPLSSANLAALEASTQADDQSFRSLWLQPPRQE
jgi:hypothetical protein